MTDTADESPAVPASSQWPSTDRATWTRLVYIMLFIVAFNVGEFVLWAMVAVQFLSKLLTGIVTAILA